MNSLNFKQYSVALSFCLAIVSFSIDPQNGQGNNMPPSLPTQAQIEKRNEIARLERSAGALIDAGHLAEAVPLLYQTMPIYRQLGYTKYSNPYQQLTKAYIGLNDMVAARRAFKNGIYWLDNDLESPEFVGEYSIFLAEQGDVEMAKLCYYSRVRWYIGSPHDKEFVPMLMVFDQDPEGDYWEFSVARLKAANLMLSATQGVVDASKWCKEASLLAPDWYYPHLQLAILTTKEAERNVSLNLAAQFARTVQEREWVAQVREVFTHPKREQKALLDAISDVNTERKEIGLLEKKRVELSMCWESIASLEAPEPEN